MISVLHTEGLQFDPGLNQLFTSIFSCDTCTDADTCTQVMINSTVIADERNARVDRRNNGHQQLSVILVMD